MNIFHNIDEQLAAVAKELGAKLNQNRNSGTEHVIYERRITWEQDQVLRSILIQPQFESGEINYDLWTWKILAWIDDVVNGPHYDKEFLHKVSFDQIEQQIDTLLTDSVQELQQIKQGDLTSIHERT